MIKVPLSSSLVIFFLALPLWLIAKDAIGQPIEDPLTIDRAVQMALEQNLGLKVQEQDLGRAQGELLKAKVFTNPELELQGETDALTSNEGEGIYSIGLGQTFFTGPKRRYRIGIAKVGLSKTENTIANKRRLLIAEVKEAFYATLLFQERLELSDELIKINERLVRLTEGRFREGFSPELDVNLAKIQLRQVLRSRMELEKELSLARSNLNLLLGLPADASQVAQGPFTRDDIRLDLSQLKEVALTQRADLKAQKLSLDQAGKEMDLARAERLPDVTLSLDYSQEQTVLSDLNFEDSSRLLGLKLSVPIPLYNRNQGEIAQARVQQEKQGLELLRLRSVIDKEVTKALIRLLSAQRALRLYDRDILPLTESHLRLTQAAYEQGLAGILDVMEAQRRFSETRLGSLEALYEYSLALTESERVIGSDLARR